MKKPRMKISLCNHPEGWNAWIDPGGVPFTNFRFIYFLGNTSIWGMNCPVVLIQLTTVTRDPRSADWTEYIWRLPFDPNIFVCLCYTIVMTVSSNCNILYVCWMLYNSWFVDLKIMSCWFKSETPWFWEWRTSGVVTDTFWWRRRKFYNHFLPVFSFLVQNWFLIPFLTSYCLARHTTPAIVKLRNFLSIKRHCSARNFSPSQGKICFLPSFVLLLHLSVPADI